MPISLSNNPYSNSDLSMSSLTKGQPVVNENGEEISRVSVGNASKELLSSNTVSGEIVQVDGDNITIKMANDTLIEAKLAGNVNVSLGQKLSFEVSKSINNQISLRPLYSNLSNSSAVMSALKSAGLPINDVTLNMTDKMMQEGMSINKNSLIDMFKSVSAHRNVSPETVVQVNKLGMPTTDNNLTQFENYRNFEHRITDDIIKITDGITDVLSEVGDSAEYLNATKQILNMVGEGLNIAAEGENGLNINDKLNEAVNDIGKLVEEYKSEIATDRIAGAIDNGYENNVNILNESGQAEETVTSNSVLNILKDAVEILSNEKTVDISEKSNEINGAVNENSDGIAPDKTPDSAKNDVDILKENSLRELLSSGKENNVDKLELPEMNNSRNLLEKINEKINDIFKSDDFKELVKDSFKEIMTLDPKDVAKEGKIDELYERIQKTSAKVMDIMMSIGKEDSVGAKAAENLNNNVNFMNNLNEFVNYVQLPLKMAGENAHGELCVYTKKKNLNNNDGNYSALLHLDMEHLGPMDVYITMRNHTKVNTNFYLESEELLDFIESHIDELTTRLSQKGYDTGVIVSKKDDGQMHNPITDEFTKNEDGNSDGIVSKLCFDVRA